MDPTARTAYEAAVARLLDGEPEPADGELVAGALRAEPGLVAAISGLLAVDEVLRQHAQPDRSAFAAAVAASIHAAPSDARFVARVAGAVGRRRPAWLPWTMAAAAGLLAVIGWWRAVAAPPQPAPVAPAAGTPAACLALLVDEAGARFAAGAAPDAVSFDAGTYELTDGVARLRFRNGADVVLVAPARIALADALHVRLESGSLRALVPPAAHGFVVDAAAVRFRDLGTEFGVTTRPGAGISDLHVFSGQVEVYQAGATVPAATLAGGESVRYAHGVAEPLAAAAEADYPTPQAIALRRWQAARARLQADPALVLYHPFEADPGDPALLRDRAAAGRHADGRIIGAQWVAGRWPGKQALQFERPGDRVELAIPGEYDEATLAAWIKVDRLDHAANVLLASVGWRPGDLQWQLDRLGSPAPTSLYSQPKRRVLWSGAPLPLGRWVHCAVTMVRSTGLLRHYVDGVPAGESQVAALTTRIMPGACVIGSWIADNKTQEDRDFRGRIDELAMWATALPPARIAALAQEGRPVEPPAPGPAAAGMAAP